MDRIVDSISLRNIMSAQRPSHLSSQARMNLHHTILVTITLQLSLFIPTLLRLIFCYHMKEPYHTSIFFWLCLGTRVTEWPSWAHSHWTWGAQRGFLCSDWRATINGPWGYQICDTWGTACHIPLHICYLFDHSSCWRAISMSKWDHLQVSFYDCDHSHNNLKNLC